MTAAWMLYTIAIGGLLGLAAFAAQHSCRLLRLPVRWIWLAGMTATVLLAVAGAVRMRMIDGMPMVPASVTALEVDAVANGETAPGVIAVLAAATGAIRRGGAAVAQRMYDAVAGTGDTVVLLIWGAASLTLVVTFGWTLLRLRRTRRYWWRHRIGGIPVLVSAGAGPALVGLLHPAIVIPQWLLGQSPERQWLVVQHEDEHRRAGDHVMLATACMLVCMMPWNITLWWMLRRTRLAVELDCDARVLRRGASARPYGEVLLEIAGRTGAHPFGAPALADSRTHLERRLIAMTARNATPRRRHAVVAAMSAVALLGAACAADLPTGAAIDEMDVTAAQVQAEQAGLLVPLAKEGSPLFIVDGVIAPSKVARSIEPDDIASIEVIKAQAALTAYGDRARHGVVKIATQSAAGGPASGEADQALPRKTVAEIEVGVAVDKAVVRGRRIELESDNAAERPLIVLDGVIADDSFSLNSLRPESIERVEVLKGAAARHLYDNPRATNGVIRITTKAGGR